MLIRFIILKNEFGHFVVQCTIVPFPGKIAGLKKLPRFIPLKMSMMAIKPIKAGYHFVRYLLTLTCMFFPKKRSADKSGNVPIPNTIINKPPFIGSCTAVAPAKATYTNPQGRMPFSMPAIKSDPFDLGCRREDNLDFQNCTKRIFENFLSNAGNSFVKISMNRIPTPRLNEIFCCNPNHLADVPMAPNTIPQIA